MLFVLMDTLPLYPVIMKAVFPILVSFLKQFNTDDILWLNCCESGFAFNFLSALFKLMRANGEQDVVVSFVVDKIASITSSLQESLSSLSFSDKKNNYCTLSGDLDDEEDDENDDQKMDPGILSSTNKEIKSRAIMLQELFHAIHIGSFSMDWQSQFSTLSESIKSVTAMCSPFTSPLLTALAIKALLVGQHIIQYFSINSFSPEIIQQEEYVLSQLIAAQSSVYSGECRAENIQLFKAALLILLALNRHSIDATLIDYTTQVPLISFIPRHVDCFNSFCW
jgi:hypothetical protein